MKKTARRIIGILFAFLLLAGMFVISCDRPVTQVTDPDQTDTPDNGRDRSILNVDTNGANQPNPN